MSKPNKETYENVTPDQAALCREITKIYTDNILPILEENDLPPIQVISEFACGCKVIMSIEHLLKDNREIH